MLLSLLSQFDSQPILLCVRQQTFQKDSGDANAKLHESSQMLQKRFTILSDDALELLELKLQ